jgi:hypothetical protein
MAFMSREERRTYRQGERFVAGRTVLYAFAAAVLVAVLAIGWATVVRPRQLDADARNRRASYERQESTRVAVSRKITEFTTADGAHQAALRAEVCELADQLRGGASTPSIDAFTSKHC